MTTPASNTPKEPKPKCPRWDSVQDRPCRRVPKIDVPGHGLLCRDHAAQVRQATLWEYRTLVWALQTEFEPR